MNLRLAILCGLVFPSVALARPDYHFTIDPDTSGLTGQVQFVVETSGTLIGNWDAKANPGGTRTKPGLFGPFGSTENLPVDTTLGGSLGDNALETQTAGTFVLSIDPVAGTATLGQLAADFVTGKPFALPLTVDMAFQSFRTRTPDSVYVGIPVSLPLGDVLVTQFDVVQTGPTIPGTLKKSGPNTYDFTAGAAAELTATIELLGTPTVIPAMPVVVALQGTVTVTGETAAVTSVAPISISDTQNPGTELPEFPLDLPTILPAGSTAHLLMNLILDQVSGSVEAQVTLNAEGSLIVPCYPDCNTDGKLDVQDFGCYVNSFIQAQPYANCNGDAQLDIQDFGCFQNAFITGCP